MFDLASELVKLASHLDTKARTADALAEDHAKSRELDDAARQTKRAKSARHFAKVCRNASKLLGVKEKSDRFKPPTWEELLDFVRIKHSDWPHPDVENWFNHFESCGWKIGANKKMVNWRSAAHNGYARWKERTPAAKSTAQTALAFSVKPDPKGWREYLRKNTVAYKEFRYAPEWMKAEFTQKDRK